MVVLAVAAVAAATLVGTRAPWAAAAPVRAQSTSDGTAVFPAADYWTETWSNPLDFDDPDDIIVADEGPMQGLTGQSVDNGVLSFSASAPGYFSPLWGGYPGAAGHGREGSFRPVDTNRFKTIAFRMFASSPTPAGIRYYTCDSGVADSCQGGFGFTAQEGWHTYVFAMHPSSDANLGQPWSGKVTGIRIALSPDGQTQFQVDWIRLLANPAADGNMSSDGERLGPIPQVLNPDALGAVPVVLNPDGSVLVNVNPPPCADYALANRNGDGWDFNAMSDSSGQDNLVLAEVANGWFHGKSKPSNGKQPGDPGVRLALGATPIDPTTYRHATVVIPKTAGSYSQRFGEGGGWVIRWLWKFVGAAQKWEVSRQIAEYPNEKVVSVDLADPNPYDGTPPSPSEIADTEKGGDGWNLPGRLVNVFRYDPHEDYASRDFWMDQIWLAQDDCGSDSFPILFRDNNWAPGTKADIYVDDSPIAFNGQLIGQNLDVTQGVNTFTWTGAKPGRYWVYVVMHRGPRNGRAYATGPLVMGVNANPCANAPATRSRAAAPACRLALAKTVTSPVPPGGFRTGDTVQYRIVATNTGTASLVNVTVADPKVTGLSCTPAVPVASLAPKSAVTCTASHPVTPADFAASPTAYVNTATATATYLPPVQATARAPLARPTTTTLRPTTVATTVTVPPTVPPTTRPPATRPPTTRPPTTTALPTTTAGTTTVVTTTTTAPTSTTTTTAPPATAPTTTARRPRSSAPAPPTTPPPLVIPPTTLAGAPTIRLSPVVGPAGFVPRAIGDGFPANAEIVLRWQPGFGEVTAHADANGHFEVSVLVFAKDVLGTRVLAWVDHPEVNAKFLVVADPLQPGGDNTAPHRVAFGR